MRPLRYFNFCPKCARSLGVDAVQSKYFDCHNCGLRLYFNPAMATACFIERSDGKILFIRRARDPGKGRLAPPGGFVDVGESAEEAVRREVREEVGIELDSIRYLSSHTNEYQYRGVDYDTIDVFFVARSLTPHEATAMDEVDSLEWLIPDRVNADDLAFPSMQAAWRIYRGEK